jgi:magnesium-protoporphyrin O-methyltransferase
MSSCCARDYQRFFGGRLVRMDLRGYRKKGLPKTARSLAADVGGDTVLDIGGGLGTLALELLGRGASRATVIEISDGYDDAAAKLAAEHELGDRIERRIGDFVEEADLVEPHDVVVLHRVVCCYPDAGALVTAAAAHTRCSLALTYPRRRPLTRFGFGLGNLWMRATRCGFRAYVHPFEAISAPAEREGLELVRREPQGLIWENAVFERLPAGAGGKL